MNRLIIPVIASLALLGSVSTAAAQSHHGPGGGGGMRGGGGAMHAPGGGGGGMRSGPSFGGRAYQAPRQASPRAYQQRSRQVERPVHRSERSRNAESRRVAPDRQRVQRDLSRNR